MSLLTTADVGNHLNINLANPMGINVATELIAAVQETAESLIGYPLEANAYVDIFDGGLTTYVLRTLAPIAGSVAAEAYDSYTDTWSDPLISHRLTKSNIVRFVRNTPKGYDNLRLTYSAGWDADTLPKDLRDAMLDLVGLKLQAVANFSSTDTTASSDEAPTMGALKRVRTADGYWEEYDSSEADAYWKAKGEQLALLAGAPIPPAILEVFSRYRLYNV